jgi:hypothetical protein
VILKKKMQQHLRPYLICINDFHKKNVIVLLFQDFGLLLFFDFGCLGLHFEEHARFDQGANQQVADHHPGRRRLCRTVNGGVQKVYISRTFFLNCFFQETFKAKNKEITEAGAQMAIED